MLFSNKTIEKILSGRGASGLTDSSAVLFFNNCANIIKKHYLVELQNNNEAYSFYNKCRENNPNLFVFYPESSSAASVPGFNQSSKRFKKEALLTLGIKNWVFCIGSKASFGEKNIPISIEKTKKNIVLTTKENADINGVVDDVVELGYERSSFASSPGTYSIRGDILDVFPHHFRNPFRISFYFNKIESLAIIDPKTQLSIKRVEKLSLSDYVHEPQNTDNINLIDHCVGAGFLKILLTRDRVQIVGSDLKKKENFNFSVAPIYSGPPKEKAKEIIGASRQFRHVYFVGKKDGPTPGLFPEGFFSKTFSGVIGSGFYSEKSSLFLVSENDLYLKKTHNHRWSPYDTGPKKDITRESVLDMSIGDHIVHQVFGVGVFNGVVNRGPGEVESIEISYNNDALVYVSLDQLSLIHKYIGVGKKPKLSTIGSKKWGLELKKTKKALSFVAKEIIALYIDRKKERPFKYLPENDFYNELKSSFSFVETEDQSRAISDVYSDMNKNQPMDRLICGDVGFGKTEVAIRAIFKSFLSDRLSVLLCPTTILADQHYITCKERLGPFGLSISLLSRFRTKTSQNKTLSLLKEKKINVLVGTHRILSKDVVLPGLGLLVIDEEHRFGVKHKERIRAIKNNVDVLTLTATPIPRTLQQSLVGLKDMSLMLTPPLSRKPIFTSVFYFDWDLIFSRIEFEINRGGQVYFLHNDTASIPIIVNKIQSRFKNYIVSGASGKTRAKDLEKTVLSFFEGTVDVLVCTTIIESGLDVTNANTIIINNAQNLGLSQLYQIRGRVGRGKRQAHCVLLIPQAPLEKEAFLRLRALEENTELGSGYSVSMKDLEIRGSGSIFGYKQSGHISSVGFHMYCELLNLEIKKTNNQDAPKNPDTKISTTIKSEINKTFIENTNYRLWYYQKISTASTTKDINKIEKELYDAFGPIPIETTTLLNIAKTRIVCFETKIEQIFITESSVEIFLANNKKEALDSLFFDSVQSFKHANLGGHLFKKSKNGNPGIVLYIKKTSGLFSLLFSFVDLFKDA